MKIRIIKIIAFAFIFIAISNSYVLGQEIDCFDGVDNDNDGSIDINDDDCACYRFTTIGDSELETDPPLTQYDNNYCFEITEELMDQSGAIWLNNKIDLSEPFNFNSVIYAGDNNANGADGFTIVFQNQGNNAIGAIGGGLGYQGITPSIGFEIDTWANGPAEGDILTTNDHVNISINGDQTNIVGNVVGGGPNFIDLGNIEDNTYYSLTIDWDPQAQELLFSINGQSIIYQEDVINNIFGGESEVWFGFTGSTGDAFNRQVVCILESDSFTFPDAGESGFHTVNCVNAENSFNLFDVLGGTPDPGGFWLDGSGNPFDEGSHLGFFNPEIHSEGNYSYTVENSFENCHSPTSYIFISFDNLDPPLTSDINNN